MEAAFDTAQRLLNKLVEIARYYKNDAFEQGIAYGIRDHAEGASTTFDNGLFQEGDPGRPMFDRYFQRYMEDSGRVSLTGLRSACRLMKPPIEPPTEADLKAYFETLARNMSRTKAQQSAGAAQVAASST